MVGSSRVDQAVLVDEVEKVSIGRFDLEIDSPTEWETNLKVVQ